MLKQGEHAQPGSMSLAGGGGGVFGFRGSDSSLGFGAFFLGFGVWLSGLAFGV